MSAAVEFVQKQPGSSKVWKQSLKSARFLGWLSARYWCKTHGQLETFRIPVLLDRGKRLKNREKPFAWIPYVQHGRFKIYTRVLVNPRCVDVGPKEAVDAMYREVRDAQTSLDGTLSVSFVLENGKIAYRVSRED